MFIRQLMLMAPADDEGLAAAISTAVEEARPADARTDPGNEDDDAAQAGGAGGEDGGAAAEGAAATGDAGAAEDVVEDADKGTKPGAADPAADRGDGRNASGQFVKKKGETDADFEARKAAAPAKGGQPEIDPKTGKPKVAKPADPLNDPIPDDIKGKTRERITGLVKIAKEASTARDTALADSKKLYDAIASSVSSPEEFADTMDMMALINSEDTSERRKGLAKIRALADRVGKDLGETPAGGDPLEGHDDLKAELEDGDISRERAIELAEARNRKKADQAAEQTRDTRTKEQREYDTKVEAARVDLNALGAELHKANPQLFALKSAALIDDIKEMKAYLPPEKWAETYRRKYNALKITVPVGDGRARVPAGTGGRQPMRPKQPANSGGRAEPKTLEEAVDFGLSQAARK